MEQLLYGWPIAAIIMALTELVKRTFKKLPAEYLPWIAILIGIISFLLVPGIAWKEGIIGGIVYGLMSAGLWDTSKPLVSGIAKISQKVIKG